MEQTSPREEKIKQVINILNPLRRQDTDLFSTSKKPVYIKLSDLSNWYPNIFNINRPISNDMINMMNNDIKTSLPKINTFGYTHVLNFKEDYSLRNPQNDTITIIKKGNNQKLTSVACEYIFRHFNQNTYDNNTSIEQAYFLSQSKTVSEINTLAQKIQIEQIRKIIAINSKQLWSITNHSYAADTRSTKEIWSSLWRGFYAVNSMADLRDAKNIKTSPIDYMPIENLYFINDVLNNIITQCLAKRNITINDIKFIISTTANRTRNLFIKTYKKAPENCLLKESAKNTPEQVQNIRKRFWLENYPISLR